MFNNLFYDEATRLTRIPTQHELWNAYLILHPQYKDLPEHYYLALKYRCDKAYPSFVRDLHFALYLKTKSKNAKVLYNVDVDSKQGIDLLIEFKGTFFAINLFVDTDDSLYRRTLKKKRHDDYSNVRAIDLPLNLNKANNIGTYNLYGENQYNELVVKIQEWL